MSRLDRSWVLLRCAWRVLSSGCAAGANPAGLANKVIDRLAAEIGTVQCLGSNQEQSHPPEQIERLVAQPVPALRREGNEFVEHGLYARVAESLGVSRTHVCAVAKGKRTSARVAAAIDFERRASRQRLQQMTREGDAL